MVDPVKPDIYLHDGTFEGLLTSVALAIKSQQAVHGIFPRQGYSPNLFDNLLIVETDRDQSFRLFGYLKSMGEAAARFAINGFLSEDREVGTHLYQLVHQCLVHGPRATQFRTHDSIYYLEKLSCRVEKEAHRLLGLIRFRILADDVQYGPFEPDCNVIGYCANHFMQRLQSQQWLLHDIRRDHALYWDCTQLKSVEVDKAFTAHLRHYGEIPQAELSEDEQYYQHLWKSFHNATANRDRTNRKLQRQFMPRRYWKYLMEVAE